MEGAKNTESHSTSAAAFVEGGIQDACDDTCSICLEDFCESDPSTVTTCKHEFHLQCVLEWCQRSSQCPMCWQSISLKDPTSQELLEAVEHERSLRLAPERTATVFHHPTLGDFELHLPMGASDSELEERIMQHLAAAASMGRAHHIARREGQRTRASGHGHPQFLVFSANPNGSSAGPASAALETQTDTSHVSASDSGSNSNRSAAGQSSPQEQDRAGPSDLQSFSESLKSRLNAVSMKYKESLSKSTRGWREKLFSRNSSMSDIGSEVRREMNAGIATVSRMMERLETREPHSAHFSGAFSTEADHPASEQSHPTNAETIARNSSSDRDAPPSHAAKSVSN